MALLCCIFSVCICCVDYVRKMMEHIFVRLAAHFFVCTTILCAGKLRSCRRHLAKRPWRAAIRQTPADGAAEWKQRVSQTVPWQTRPRDIFFVFFSDLRNNEKKQKRRGGAWTGSGAHRQQKDVRIVAFDIQVSLN